MLGAKRSSRAMTPEVLRNTVQSKVSLRKKERIPYAKYYSGVYIFGTKLQRVSSRRVVVGGAISLRSLQRMSLPRSRTRCVLGRFFHQPMCVA